MVGLIKKYKLFLLLIVLFLLFSCSGDEEREREIRRFKNEYRDPKLIGKWVFLDSAINQKEDNYYRLLKKDGEIIEIYIEGDYKQKDIYYFYTKGDSIFVLDLGDGFKANLNIDEYKYHISNDTLTVKTKSGAIGYKAVKVSDNPN